jgi:hypothetical protein
MADAKISNLPVSTLPLAGTEVLPLVQSGVTKQVATNDLTVKNIRSNATSGVLQVAGPAAASTRVMTTPDANFTAARTDAGQTFIGNQAITGALSATTTISASSVDPATTDVSTLGGAGKRWQTGFIKNIDSNAGPLTLKFQGVSIAVATATGLAVTGVLSATDNVVIGTAGKGIDFSVDGQAAGMTSELLDDYEEGTWTPSVGGDATYTTQTGWYTKIGRQVTVTAKLQINVLGTGSVNVISGLPFTAGNFGFQAGNVFYYAGINASVTMLGIATDGNTATFKISYSTGNVTTTLVTPTLFQNNARIDFSATYQI